MDPFIRITIKDEAGRIQCLDVARGSCLDIVEAGARKESAPDAHRRGQEMQELRVRADTLMSKFTELGEIFGLKPAIGGGDHMGFVDAVMEAIRTKVKPDVGHICAGCFAVVSNSDPALRRVGGKTWHALCLDNWVNAHA